MVASTDVKFYTNANINAPELTNAWGSIIDVLDACLVNGFGSQTVASISNSDTIITVNFGSPHNFMQHQVIKINGANQSEYNGEHRILTVPNANSFTFKLQSIPSVEATGTITCALPDMGWEKKYSSTNKAVYKPNGGMDSIFLRVDASLPSGYTETWAKSAKITVSDSMLDVDTFDGNQMPYNPSNPNLNHVYENNRNGWFKWFYSVQRSINFGAPKEYMIENEGGKAAATRWLVVGNKEFFLFIPRIQTYNDVVHIYGFGKIKNIINNSDNYALFVSNCPQTVSQQIFYANIDGLSGSNSSNNPNCYLFYDISGLPNYKAVQHFNSSPFGASKSNYHGFTAGNTNYSGTVNTLKSYQETGLYFGFDIIGFSENLPVFKVPHIKSMLQIASQFTIQANGYLTIKTVELESGAAPSYLIDLRGA